MKANTGDLTIRCTSLHCRLVVERITPTSQRLHVCDDVYSNSTVS